MSFLREISRNRYLYLLALPGLLFLAVFAYYPMYGYAIAFVNYSNLKGLWRSQFVGLANFHFFFLGPDWLRVTGNTLMLNSLFLVFGLAAAILIAVALNEVRSRAMRRVLQSLIFLPYFISWMVVRFMVFALFNSTAGLVNKLLRALGETGVNWYQRPEFWPAILTGVYAWKFSGYFSIILLAAITGISPEYYESARIDGASRLQQIFRITLPLIRPITIILVLMAMGRIFYGDFGMIYGIIGDQGLLFPTTDVIDTYTFRALRQLGNFSMSASVVLYQSCVGLLVILFSNWLVKRIDSEQGLF